jgi:8-oxo-dGTP diphosphatase
MSRPQTPVLTVDVVIAMRDRSGAPVVLIERRNEPFGWALPGGFVDLGETVEHAAAREAREETGLEVLLGPMLGVYSEPGRDPRGHTVSIVFTGTATGQPVAGDDARAVGIHDLDALPPLVFDHARILEDYRAWIEQRKNRC